MCSTPSADTSPPTVCGRPDRRLQAKTSVHSEPHGVPHPCFGSWDAEIYARAKEAGRLNEIHSPHFAPVIHPTLETGVETLVVAAQAWLG